MDTSSLFWMILYAIAEEKLCLFLIYGLIFLLLLQSNKITFFKAGSVQKLTTKVSNIFSLSTRECSKVYSWETFKKEVNGGVFRVSLCYYE